MNDLTLPDVASSHAASLAPLSWVGMEQIDIPLAIPTSDGIRSVSAKARCQVNLPEPAARGIHMSRLYLLLGQQLADQPLTTQAMQSLLEDMAASHSDISDQVLVTLEFDLPLLRPALLSQNRGWKSYPVRLHARMVEGQLELSLALSVAYSSTCPCSAALSRQLLAKKIDQVHPEQTIDKSQLLAWLQSDEGSVATPHSQRSYCQLSARLAPGELPIEALINGLEKALSTPVQTAVKREDEQEFARLNGENLMFCEDAARRVKAALSLFPTLGDYWFKVEHQESLHPHNAVAIDVKGVPGGFQAHWSQPC